MWPLTRFVAATVVMVSLVGCRVGGQPEAGRSTPVVLPTLSAEEIAQGRQVYTQYCASCHGPNAEGAASWQEPDASGNLPPPPQDDRGHTWRHSDRQLAQIIREGQRDPFNASPELTMPPFRDQLGDAEIAAVITYFKSLWSVEHRAFQEEQNQRPQAPMTGGGS